MSLTQLKNEIALKIRENKLNNFLELDDITERVIKKIKSEGKFKGLIPELENPIVASGPKEFPRPDSDDEEESDAVTREAQPATPPATPPAPVAPSVDTTGEDIQTEYEPELPDMIKNIEPGKIFVLDYLELDENGEQLSVKPFKTLEDPDIKISQKEMWLTDGKKSSEVYIAKFEKIGDLNFDYINGTAKFTEIPSEPAVEPALEYKENPYKTEMTPEMIQTSVDVEKVAQDVIKDLLKKAFAADSIADPGETEKADWLNANQNAPEHNQYDLTQKDLSTEELPKRADDQDIEIDDTRITDGHNNPDELGYVVNENIKLEDLTKIDSEFKKTNTPPILLEALAGRNANTKIVQKTKEVMGWEIDGIKYFLPANPLSTKKCYIKK